MLEIARKAHESQSTNSKSITRIRTSRQLASVERTITDELVVEESRSVTPVGVNYSSIPVITGEAHYKGVIPVDGIIVGHHGKDGASLEVRRSRRTELPGSLPELSGELRFRDMVRINGHIAGSVYSESGTLIVASGAAVDANVDVGVAVIKGTVNGDIVAQQRVELGPGSKVCGNIRTRSIEVAVGADFEGVCSMLEDRKS